MKALGFLFGLWSFLDGIAMIGAWMNGKHMLFVWACVVQALLIALALRIFKE